MHSKITYYLVLQNETNSVAVNAAIYKQYKATIHPLFPHEPQGSPTRNFFTTDIESDKKNCWQVAQNICKIQGVLEADPQLESCIWANKPEKFKDVSIDPYWNHKAVRFPEAINKAEKELLFSKNIGTNISIFQLDTGYTEHPSVYPQIQANRGINFVETDKVPLDTLEEGSFLFPGHGTATASVVVGAPKQDKNHGVFPYVEFIPYRISSSVIHILGNTITAGIVSAVNSGAQIITMSMGGVPSSYWLAACEYAYQKGVIFVCAAGNQVKEVVFPARYYNTISVAAVNQLDFPWEGTCRGTTVDISAPGEDVYVAETMKGQELPVYDYKISSGTSYATPHVAAAAALWLHYFKEELKQEFFTKKPYLKVEAFRWAIQKSKRTPDVWGRHGISGNLLGGGILDVKALLEVKLSDFVKQHQSFIDTVRKRKCGYGNIGIGIRELLSLLSQPRPLHTTSIQQYIAENASVLAKTLYEEKATQQAILFSNKSFTPKNILTDQQWIDECQNMISSLV